MSPRCQPPLVRAFLALALAAGAFATASAAVVPPGTQLSPKQEERMAGGMACR